MPTITNYGDVVTTGNESVQGDVNVAGTTNTNFLNITQNLSTPAVSTSAIYGLGGFADGNTGIFLPDGGKFIVSPSDAGTHVDFKQNGDVSFYSDDYVTLNVNINSNYGNIYASNSVTTTNVVASGTVTIENTTSGPGRVSGQQVYRLTSDLGYIGTLPSFFFSGLETTSGTAINLEGGSVYDIEMFCLFFKDSYGSVVDWSLVTSSAPTYISGYYTASPITGTGAGTPTTGYTAGGFGGTPPFPTTGFLEADNSHTFSFKIQIITNEATTFGLRITQYFGGVLPLAGSYYRVTKISPTTGLFS